jgi:asparaginyl-tRNA synthetase
MEFNHVKDAEKMVGKKIRLRGWVHRQRAQKAVAFVVLRDATGIIQCTAKQGQPFFDDATKTGLESSITLEGTVRKEPRAPGGFEVEITKFGVVSRAERFPIKEDASTEFLRDVRHLWLRSQKITQALKVRSTVFGAIHEYFRGQGFYEYQSPSFTPTPCEGGSTVFEVKYFDRTAYLTQSWQLYAEAGIFALEKMYTVAPSFRAEPSRTPRHLTEFWHAEMEQAWAGLDDIITHAEGVVSHCAQAALKENPDELAALGANTGYLKKIKPPFPRVTYDEALKILKKDGMDVPWGKDLRTLEERQLLTHYDRPVFVTHYPKESMAFYKRADPKNPKLALCFDLIAHNVGEIIGGSERDNDVEAMRKKLVADGEKLENYEWYFDLRRYGAIQHSGFGLGVDRIVQWVTGVESIQDVIPFPRTMDRLTP